MLTALSPFCRFRLAGAIKADEAGASTWPPLSTAPSVPNSLTSQRSPALKLSMTPWDGGWKLRVLRPDWAQMACTRIKGWVSSAATLPSKRLLITSRAGSGASKGLLTVTLLLACSGVLAARLNKA